MGILSFGGRKSEQPAGPEMGTLQQFDEAREQTGLNIRWVKEDDGRITVSLNKSVPPGEGGAVAIEQTSIDFASHEARDAEVFYAQACERLRQEAGKGKGAAAAMESFFRSHETTE